jgi:WhiB family redox-sensing transcriptional regulator
VTTILVGYDREPAITWQERALCADTSFDLFFPERGESTWPAKRVCVDCPVRNQCLDFALDHMEKFGIWGGHSERERRRLRRLHLRSHDLGVFTDEKDERIRAIKTKQHDTGKTIRVVPAGMDTGEVAEMFDVSVETVRRWRRRGLLVDSTARTG